MSAQTLPRTALRGRSRSSNDELAKSLGYLSIGLGLVEVLAPRLLCRAIGLVGREGLVRAYGAREIATGVAILNSHDPTPWIWGRVAGDALDLATLSTAGGGGGREGRNAIIAMAVVAGVTAVDVICASGLKAEKGGRSTAVADYSDRSGFPESARAMRGAAKDFVVPKDMRVPDALRADVFERRARPDAASIGSDAMVPRSAAEQQAPGR